MALYFTATILCDTNYNLVNLSDLYQHQQQLAICSTPHHIPQTLGMSSNALLNMSNELPSELPVPPSFRYAKTPATPAMSPRTIATTLQTNDDIDAALLWQIASSLLQTIANRETEMAIATKWYKDWVHTLEQCILHYEATFNEPPMGHVLNGSQVPHFHIPVSDGLYQPAKWIKLNNDGTISGYFNAQGPNEQPYVINLFSQADISTNSPIKTLLNWFRHMLTGPGGNFQILQTIVAKTDDWGLAREIARYHELNNNITMLAVKLKAYQQDINTTRANLMGCESCLMLACTTKWVSTLQNMVCKLGAIRLGWKRTNRGMCPTYIHGCLF
jgi:hypothetical protein